MVVDPHFTAENTFQHVKRSMSFSCSITNCRRTMSLVKAPLMTDMDG